MSSHYDIVVIGAGAGGLTAAIGCANIGKRVLLVERSKIGGECTHTGCIPSKALLHHATHYQQTLEYAPDNTAMRKFRDQAFSYAREKVAAISQHETVEQIEKQGIDVIIGDAAFTDRTKIKIKEQTYTFSRAIIATGSAPRTIAIPGAAPADVLTNETFFDLKNIPTHLLIVGGGAIGVEMAQALQYLGCNVTIVEAGETFLPRSEPALAQALHEHLTSCGVRIFTQTTCQEIANKQAILRSNADGQSHQIPHHKILVAIGRTPNLPSGLKEAGVSTTNSGVSIDASHRTTNRRIYAIGDVALRAKFTHTADASARSVVSHIASFGFLGRRDRRAIPSVLYTNPELAQIGMTSAEAEQYYGANGFFTLTIPFQHIDRAITDSQTDGSLVLITRRLTGRILGAHILGAQAGEVISYFTLAIDNKWTIWRLARSIYPYPTYSLVIKKAFSAFLQTQRTHLKSDLKSLLSTLTPYAVVIALWITLIVISYRWIDTQAEGDEVATVIMLLSALTQTAWGPFVYVLTYALRPLILFPALWLSILAGVFFGFWLGSILTLLGAVLSAGVAYGVGRWFNRQRALRNSDELAGWHALLQNRPFESILIMRLTFLPFDAISYLAGILKIRFLPYTLASIIGIIPGTAMFVALGASVNLTTIMEEGINPSIIDIRFIFLSAIIFLLAIGVSAIVRRYQAKQTPPA